jgi:hypothetical protein
MIDGSTDRSAAMTRSLAGVEPEDLSVGSLWIDELAVGTGRLGPVER